MRSYNLLALVVAAILISTIVSAATSISTSISTGGQLSVTGTTTLLGNVGIGTMTPTSTLEVLYPATGVTGGELVVDGPNKTVYVGRLSSVGGDNSSFAVRNRLGTINFLIDQANSKAHLIGANFGLGTTAPATLFHLSGNSSNLSRIERTTSAATSLEFKNTVASVFTGISLANFYIATTSALNTSAYMSILQNGNTGFGVAAASSQFQIASSTGNATTSIEIGRTGQNKGSCLVLYDVSGTVVYVTVQNNTLVVSSTNCK